MNLRRIRAVARKEFLHILRDPRSLVMALAMPLSLLLLFGYALTLDVDRIPMLIEDQDGTPESRELARRFAGSRYFTVKAQVDSPRAIDRAIDRGEILMGAVIPRGFGEQMQKGGQATVELLLDGGDSNTAAIALGYADALVQLYGAELRLEWQSRRGAPKLEMPVDARLRVLYNEELKSKNYIVPGLIAVILMLIASMLTSLCVAREWESGTMEQLLSTPVRPFELLLGKLSAYFVLGIADMVISLVAGVGIFGVPLHGSVWVLFLSACVFLFGALCWGLMLSAAMRNQLMAYQAALLSSFLPAFLLSGFVYAIETMPLPPRIISHIVPSRYFVTILKGIFLKGIGLELLWGELLLLAVYAAIVMTLAVRKLRQKVA